MRKLIFIAVCAFAAAALPALAGAGAVHSTETFTDMFTSFFGPDPCVDKFVTGLADGIGHGRTSSNRRAVAAHARVDLTGQGRPLRGDQPRSRGSATGCLRGHVDVRSAHQRSGAAELKGAVTGVTAGPFVLADGRVFRRQVSFHLTFDDEGLPAKGLLCPRGLLG